jgi:hypothetical protein
MQANNKNAPGRMKITTGKKRIASPKRQARHLV